MASVRVGRPKGTANRATQIAREAIADFVDGNAHRLVGWLDQMGQDNPEAAFKAFMSVVEYHIPKLQRTDVQPLDSKGQPSNGFTISVNHVSKAD